VVLPTCTVLGKLTDPDSLVAAKLTDATANKNSELMLRIFFTALSFYRD
jgi:hypothetical protein